MTYPFVPLIAALEKNTLLLLSSATSIFNLGHEYLCWCPGIGVIGAAVATGLASVLHLALYWLVFRFMACARELVFPFKAVLRTAINLVPAVAIAMLARPYLDSALNLLLVTFVGGGSYALAMYWNHDLSVDELAMLRKATGRSGQPDESPCQRCSAVQMPVGGRQPPTRTARWLLSALIIIQFFPIPPLPGLGFAPENFIFLVTALYMMRRVRADACSGSPV